MAEVVFPSPFVSLLFFLTAAAIFSTAVAAQLDDDKQTLLRIKNYWGGPSSLESWINGSASPCRWNGISCSGETVTGIALRDQGIDGDVPPFVCDLKNLTILDLYNNSIRGGFPGNTLSRCTNLVYLELSQNYLNGSLPADLDRILSQRLEHLGLAGNYFQGALPAAVTRFPAMRLLFLDNNWFTGSIPPEIFGAGGNLSNLESLTLAYNNFTPAALPAGLSGLKKLRFFWMSAAGLIGEIPASIGELLELDYLELAENQLTGRIPDSLWGLTKLRIVYLYKNNLEGELMTSSGAKFGALGLEEIDISRNKLTGRIPVEFGKLLKLKILFLYGNRFSGEIPAAIGSLPNLFDIRLFNNRLTGPLPTDMGKNSPLWNFEVWENSLTGELPRDLCANGRLITVIAHSNSLSGAVPDSLGNCSSLLDIRLSNNGFSGELPPRIWTLKNLNALMMENNKLSGMPPDTLPWNLTRLQVSNNLFSGRIPSSASGLAVFTGANNSFSGELPRDLKGMAKIQVLVLEGNNISGDIPASVAALRALTNLDLSKNQLTGAIPEELGSLPVLTSLDLSDNRLSGKIPDKLANLKLNLLNLSSNALEGQIPQALQNGAYEGSFLSNPGLCSGPGGDSLLHLPRCAAKSRKEMSKGVFILVLSLGVLIALAGLVFAFVAIRDLRRKKSEWDRANWKLTSFQSVGFGERSIVRGISTGNLVGCGGSGEVYRVDVGGGEVVAVKKIRSGFRKLDRKLEKEFLAEVEILGSIRHMNIVRLLCCVSSDDSKTSKLLVYEYMENGSLHQWLHSKRRMPDAAEAGGHLDWPKRLEIAVGAAQGLCYMHHGCNPPIVHRDVKSSNILLDADFKPKVADFGLARMLERGDAEPQSVTTVAGSFGYMAPECAYSKKIDEKMDVYSFGVVLLELVTGKQAHDGGGDSCLAEWVWRHFQESNGSDSEILEVVDEQVRDPLLVLEFATVIKLGLMCTGSLPSQRPTMKSVLQLLLRCAGAASAVWGYHPTDEEGKEYKVAGPLLKKGSRRSRRSKGDDQYGGDSNDASALV